MSAAPAVGLGPGEVWEAPVASGPLDATVEVPGSKSLTNRYLVLAALAEAPVRIRGGLRSRDSALMIDALRALGVTVDDSGPEWLVTPAAIRGGTHIECGLAGTVMRFVPPLVLLAGTAGDMRPVTFDGDEGARVRPMGPLLDALRALGATVDDDGRGTLPFTLTPPASVPGEVVIDSSSSSQFVTALLLVAPRMPQGLTVRHVGETLPSLPHIDMTCETLRGAGIRVDQPDERTWIVHPGALRLTEVRVEPDLSNAGPFMAAALVAGGEVRIPGWPATTTQPGAYYPELLMHMGGECELAGDVMRVRGTGRLDGIEADLSPAGEITPTIAALCALASGASQLNGIGHLRGHETDRLAAIAAEVERLGGQCHAGDDSLKFAGYPPTDLHGAAMETYHDHRMATFAAIVGLRVPGVQVLHVGTTSKTMPDFPTMWRAMLGLSGDGTATDATAADVTGA
ncbi:3-phosphoshikimate 1-carboxyvinyltransferase [Demequina sp. NBRC 110052]|uniref:3-phosphoshikimate 1-carboxyvinyltransferase n=1 Tax=Demequina sp. NBRC 110052 TaxID=1570341 RepID=UPI000A01A36F|nr:3-phosphoshikimate 1-carboxyvinyltransferase [Demequina sp. NBRC 110052]